MFRMVKCDRGNRVYRLAILLTVAAFAVQLISAERLPVKTYTVADGLLRDMVSRIRQDSLGFLWFCTAEGISRFDGYGFTNFRTDDGLPDRHVNDFLETRSGNYLIATDAGLARLNPKGLRGSQENPLFTVYLPEDPKANGINVLYEDRSGTIWVGTNDGMYRLNDKFELENVPLETPAGPLDVISLLQDRSGALWIGAWNKLFRIQPSGKVDAFSAINGLTADAFNALYEDANGQIWIGLRPGDKGGLLRLVKDPSTERNIVEKRYYAGDGLPSVWITNLIGTSDGKFWVGTTEGLCLWQGDGSNSVCKTYSALNGLCDFGVSSLAEDKDGNVWVGTL